MGERNWQVSEELFPAGKNNMVRRQHRKGPAPGAPARDEHTTGLCDERLAFGDARIAGFKLPDIVFPIGKYSRQTQGRASAIGQFPGMTGDLLPAFFGLELANLSLHLARIVEQLKLRLKIQCIRPEELDTLVKGVSDRG